MNTIPISEHYKEALTAYSERKPGQATPPVPGSPVIAEVDIVVPANPTATVKDPLKLGRTLLVMPRKEANDRGLKIIAQHRAGPGTESPPTLPTEPQRTSFVSPQVFLAKGNGRQFDIIEPPNTKCYRFEADKGLRGEPKGIVGWKGWKLVASPTSVEAEISWDGFTPADQTLLRNTNKPDVFRSDVRGFMHPHRHIEYFFVGVKSNDEATDWFATLAPKLLDTEVHFNWWRPSKKVVPAAFQRLWATLGGENRTTCKALTASLFTLKMRADMVGVATVFSYNPVGIAADLRKARAIELLGTDTAKYLLQNIFNEMVNGDEKDAPIKRASMKAARDVIVAYLDREDHHHFVQADYQPVEDKLKKLFSFLDTIVDPSKPNYKLEAVKTGLVYSAIIGSASDTAERNEEKRGILGAVTNGVGSVLGAAAGMAPMGGALAGQAVNSLKDVTWKFIDTKLQKKNTATDVIDDAQKTFNFSVIELANKGYIQVGGKMQKVDAEVAKEYADTVSKTVKSLMPKLVNMDDGKDSDSKAK